MLQTGFLNIDGRSLHLSVFHPEIARLDRGERTWVVHVPAFAEEMNKSRALISRQARLLIRKGISVVVPDLSRTGDSAGHFKEARWDSWIQDLISVESWVRSQNGKDIVIWGNRLGCLLASNLASQLETPPDKIVFWQPVYNGKQHMSQFLRLHMASEMMSGHQSTVDDLEKRLVRDGFIEIAGYCLDFSLFSDICEETLSVDALPKVSQTHIFEVSQKEEPSLSAATRKFVAGLEDTEITYSASAVSGDRYWMTQELGLAPELEQATLACFSEQPGFESEQRTATLERTALLSKSLDNTEAIVSSCGADEIACILHEGSAEKSIGVIIVVGGPQYRVGSHRLFVYLAKSLAAANIPVLRFDFRGMGDSSGKPIGFLEAEPDIKAAIDALVNADRGVEKVVLWGLCDGATAAMSYASIDNRVSGLIVANPWVYTPKGSAKTLIKYYYVKRFFSLGFWRKVFSGSYAASSSLKGFTTAIGQVIKPNAPSVDREDVSSQDSNSSIDLSKKFAAALAAFNGDVLILLSENDLTSTEFSEACRSNQLLKRQMERKNVTTKKINRSDHTFSREEWKAEVAASSVEYICKKVLATDA